MVLTSEVPQGDQQCQDHPQERKQRDRSVCDKKQPSRHHEPHEELHNEFLSSERQDPDEHDPGQNISVGSRLDTVLCSVCS